MADVSRFSLVIGRGGRGRLRAVLRLLALVIVVVGLGVGAVDFVVTALSRVEPPVRPGPVPAPAVEVRGPRAYIGPSWMSRERGLWELHLEGAPYAIGYAESRLGTRQLGAVDELLHDVVHWGDPAPWTRWEKRLALRWRYRRLSSAIAPDRLLEIAGEAAGYLDLHDELLPTYQRLMLLQALTDVAGDALPVPLVGATAFAVSGTATPSGHLLVGRVLDFSGGDALDGGKVVHFVKPEGRIAFASVSWSGAVGVLTGLSAEGIFVSVHPARSDDAGRDGTPPALLAREVLETAHTLDDAVKILREARPLGASLFVVADGKSGDASVIERWPGRTEVRRSRDVIVATDHALAPAFAADSENDRERRYLTSGARYKRLGEIVRQHKGGFDPKRVLDVLRDKLGDGGAPLGIGHPSAIDSLQAVHGVVVDATALVLWVSTGPHLLGRFVGYDLRKELLGEEHPDPPDLPPDPLDGSEDLRRAAEARRELAEANTLRAVAPERALECAERAIGLDDKLPDPHRLIADLLRNRDRDRAREEYLRFLALAPPYLHDVEEVKGILASL